MRISEQWLREWVELPDSMEDLAHRLTMAGLEVEAVEPAAPAFTGVVVGEILRCEPHPDADTLQLCEVAGGDETLTVVCGAPNARTGLKAPFATIGGVLPGDLRIRQANLRGVTSQGMLCSAKELGLSDDAAGLMELPADAPLGADLRDYLTLDDTIIEVDLTPNRGDCLGMAGVAREVAVAYRAEVTGPSCASVAAAVGDTLPVRLDVPEACPRYVGRVVRDVDTSVPTPVWMRERLRRAGIRPLSITVDITNYVMLELGQPLHAFDLATLAGGIHVRRATPGESLALLNGETVELDDQTLVIADDHRPVAMAGVMGGEATAVSESTRDVFLEAAFFTPLTIAGRARGYGLSTESSHRFERGVDPALAPQAMERATALLTAIAGGQPGPVGGAVSPDDLPASARVALRPRRVDTLLGTVVPRLEMRAILQCLGLAVTGGEGDDEWQVAVPSWRFDIAREVDLIEEIVRIHGYEAIPLTRTPAPLAMSPRSEMRVGLRRLRRVLVDRDYQEAITYSFVAEVLQQQLDPQTPALALANPLSADMAVMRTTLWPGLVRALVHNHNRQHGRVRLFESGLRFRGDDGATLEQTPMIAGIIGGTANREQWITDARSADFFDIKGDVEAMLALTGEHSQWRFAAEPHPALHPGQSARIYRGDRALGWLGALHPRLEKPLELPGRTYVFELELQPLEEARVPAFSAPSRYPSVRRDIAIVVAQETSFAGVREVIAESAGDWLQDVIIFDVYRGRGIAEGSKSLAMGLILQDSSRTLTDEDVEACIERVVGRLGREFNAVLRE